MNFIDFFNIGMSVVIVFVIFSIREVDKENKILRAKNEREQARLSKMYGWDSVDAQ